MDDLIKGLTILRRYGNPAYPTHCEHDVLRVDIEWDMISDEDKLILSQLGFEEDTEFGKIMSYKFGSC